MGRLDPYGLAVLDRQLVAQFVPEVTVVANVAHRGNKIAIILVGLASDHAVMAFVSADIPIGAALEFTSDMRKHLQRTNRARSFAHCARALVEHQRRIETDFEV